ncbi:MAG: MBL fold metallo-hydrolase [Bacilli bacterium]|jgi:phosphoribosyl 1,2-cyclic phosphodiesterase|nr:MBL fold metallo-hydrolase [Bacilli bacterium]
MKTTILASGSKGNSTFVEVDNHRFLIDLGVSCRYIEKKLKEINIEPKSIKNILITHTHNDHICGLPSFYKKYQPTIYILPSMLKDLKLILGDFKYEFFSESNIIDETLIEIIKTSHDKEESIGFLINNKLVYITDTGYINKKYFNLIKNKEIYILESNHDVEMLLNGKYYYHLKQRILSDKGHLSNKVASQYLSKLIGEQTKYIILVHLSEENNTEERVLETLLSHIDKNNVEKIIVAEQYDRTELVEV